MDEIESQTACNICYIWRTEAWFGIEINVNIKMSLWQILELGCETRNFINFCHILPSTQQINFESYASPEAFRNGRMESDIS